MAIDRTEFLHQFQLEVSEHLSNLYRGLLHLQKNPSDKGTLKLLMTSAHTISGTAAMLALRDISRTARNLENIFKTVLENTDEMNAEQFNISFNALLIIAAKKVFDKYHQIHDTAKRQKGGTGLGLAVVRSIITAHKGDVWAESEPGKGARLIFTLPKSQPRNVCALEI